MSQTVLGLGHKCLPQYHHYPEKYTEHSDPGTKESGPILFPGRVAISLKMSTSPLHSRPYPSLSEMTSIHLYVERCWFKASRPLHLFRASLHQIPFSSYLINGLLDLVSGEQTNLSTWMCMANDRETSFQKNKLLISKLIQINFKKTKSFLELYIIQWYL